MDVTAARPVADAKRRLLRVVFGVALVGAAALPHAQSTHDRHRVRIVLVGDSTVTDEHGWGLGFRRLLTDDVECVNPIEPAKRIAS